MRKLAIAIVTATLATTLTACGGAGNDAPTRLINQVTDGVDATLDKSGNLIYLRNIRVAVNAAGDAQLIGTIINEKDTKDALLALSINHATVKIDAKPALLNTPIIFGGPSATAAATLPASGLVVGNRVPVSFFFGLAGAVTVDALVVDAASM